MDYSLRELECFLAVAEELSFTRAARRLHLAQPPLSRHVRMLEERLGASLFVREPRRVSLTEAGRALYEETKHVPALLTRAGEQARRCAEGENARMRLGFVSAVMNDELLKVFGTFRQQHPGVEIMLQDLPPHEQLVLLAEGRIDGGFVGVMPEKRPAGLRFLPWFEEPVVCLVPADHPLSKRRRVKVADLRKEAFVAVSREAAPAFADQVRKLCRREGFRPRLVLESHRAQAVALMVAAGSGIALLPATVAHLVKEFAVALSLEGSHKVRHAFAMREVKTNAWVERFAETLGSTRARPASEHG